MGIGFGKQPRLLDRWLLFEPWIETASSNNNQAIFLGRIWYSTQWLTKMKHVQVNRPRAESAATIILTLAS